jgi:hypothetical protein
MKKRLLPIGLFSLLVFAFAIFYLIDANAGDNRTIGTGKATGNLSSADYLARIRNNQNTGILNPKDVLIARQQMESHSLYKSGNSGKDLDWIEMGPDNIGGKTSSLIVDNRDATSMTLYAGAVTGGMFKSTNFGSSWFKINQTNGTENLNVTCMVQDASGTIYVGTGEGQNANQYSSYGLMDFEGGFIGHGIFKSDASDNFQLVPGTEPYVNGDVTEWAYINKLALDTKGNRLFAATHTGLKYASLSDIGNWQSVCKYQLDSTIISRTIKSDSIIVCDSFKIQGGDYVIFGQTQIDFEITQDDTTNVEPVYNAFVAFDEPGNCFDVSISSDGWIISSFKGLVYVSESGDPNKFVNRSVYPGNPDKIRKDEIAYTTHITIRDKSGATLHDSTNNYSKEFDWHINYVQLNADLQQSLSQYPSSNNVGRVSYAIAPSNQSIVYAMAAKSSDPRRNSLFNVYISEDKGGSWRIIAPGGSDMLNLLGSDYTTTDGITTLFYRGDYCNTLAVFPNDPYKILAGSVNVWEGIKVNETGYFQWTERSVGTVINPDGSDQLINGIFNGLYCHQNHHSYTFVPGYDDVFFVTTDGGIYLGGYYNPLYVFQSKNKNFNVTQYYTIDISNAKGEVMGGTQSNGTLYISGSGSTPMTGADMWRPANLDPKYPEGTDGGFVAFSNIRSKKGGEEEIPPSSFYSKSPIPRNEVLTDRIRRSETLGYDFSLNLFAGIGTAPTNTNFLTPMILWESYNNLNSRDSIYFYADKNYLAGDSITVKSQNKQPFHHVLQSDLNAGDSIKVQDIVSTKLFLATKDNIYMTVQALRFDLDPEWFKISDKAHAGFMDNPSCLAFSSDADYLFVGTYEGDVYRIANIALAYNEDLADVSSPECIIATNVLEIYSGNTQAVTSIAVDPKNSNKVLVTLGNYGNTNYVYYSNNALADAPVFVSVQGDPATTGLPRFPVYSSVLEMQPETDKAIIGTEEGIWVSDNVASGEWYPAGGAMGKVPVMDLKQQTVYKGLWVITTIDPVTNIPAYEYYPKIENYGMIYAGTHGRGVFRNENFFTVGEEEHSISDNSNSLNLNIYPNPASQSVNLEFNLQDNSDVRINIYNLSGKLVYSETRNNTGKGSHRAVLNTNTLTTGTYIIEIRAGRSTSSSRMVIVK